MSLFKRSTRQVVAGGWVHRKKKGAEPMEEEKLEQQGPAEDGALVEGTGLTKLRAWATLPRIGGIALALILVTVLVAVVPHLRPSGTTTAQPEATDAALTDGRYIVTLPQVLDISGSGSLVQIFASATAEDGTVSYAPVEALRYLESCEGLDGSTAVYMSEAQVRTYLALEGRCAAVVVGCGSQDAASKRLAWQSSYNSPTVRLAMEEATKTVAKGAKVQLGVKVQVTPEDAPYGSVSWTSSDETVATVDGSGMVSGVEAGTATITAACGDVSTSCTVTVYLVPTEIRLPESLIVGLGRSEQMTAQVLPEGLEDPVTWASSDEAVAVVDGSGSVQGIAEGTATITAVCGDVSASCTVTVQMLPDSIALNPESLHLKVGDTGTIAAQVLPDSVTDKTVVWTSSDETVATVDETGKVTAVAAGQADITGTCGGVSAVCPVVVE